MSKYNRFQPGTGCFKCENCGRKTRATGVQSLESKCCPECFEALGIENEMADRGETPELLLQWEKWLDRAESKGGRPDGRMWWK